MTKSKMHIYSHFSAGFRCDTIGSRDSINRSCKFCISDYQKVFQLIISASLFLVPPESISVNNLQAVECVTQG